MNKRWRNIGLYVLIVVVVIFVGSAFFDKPSPTKSSRTLRYSDFIEAVQEKQISRVLISPDKGTAQIVESDGNRALVNLAPDQQLLQLLTDNDVDIAVQPTTQANPLQQAATSLIFPILLLGGLFFLFRRAGSGGGGNPAMNFGKSKARLQMEPETKVTFGDVAGIEGAKLELTEVVDFLKNPDRFTAVGAKIPKGVLLVGPPGTGKTLLAKAVAGEASVPFFSISGSEFVEMFVGVGASRVRDLFEQAKKNAPCIVFIDEIDAVGRQRGAGLGGGNDEREQTLNQLLTEMDGFEGNSGIIIVAATNRPDVLDSALMRPGRFDRQVTVDRPDYSGRLQILNVHAKSKTLSKAVDLDQVARRTPGFTGADLANLLNEAAILAARRELTEVSNDEVSDAIERIMVGPEKKDSVISEKRKKLVAYHEAGHAVVGAVMPDYDPVQKISIIPRGGAGGLTFFTPSEERMESGLYSRSYLQNQMAVALGGRVAEEIIYGEDEVTTGASNDLKQVASVARQMITKFGMSDKLGPVALGRSQGGMFLGRDISAERDFSEDTAATIDSEVSVLVEIAYERAKKALNDNRQVLEELTAMLMETETVDSLEFQDLLIRHEVKVAEYA
ncbi:MAG: ATP-dependent metallopeptidase FtsH/Yme1/Tma family protein [Prochlorococcus sp. MED-G73]|uniref:ATP-dependent zinc metalloprotease FtsH n=1 Tax=Prochlorococcus marinus (strain NATL2A) TaxID=59920 RepID=Q46HE5_PROMT|nr:ATP-dependent zinc metalloprotease FtsH [Prochlorococcus marinus]MAJ25908.1 cell division protein FtsH [Prochlorococcus sp. MED630]RCL48780.1 MAG: ATP-dependent metallopeptidase FtsH/Yme1/Tma family protein [Prochlorococcus sp. MED-G73]AAZ59083.1 membrane protease FtsH catalytic subunit [Prochlorococcus marinus str. NATL2A]MBW3048730.1 ATP-dependent zinc metalloprotease FtsH [Prochlorococcus marinus str. MU1403]PYE03303.1 ATP-dependent metallopeptidase FtsH/Yme1/Tma family protein [Prochlor